MQRRIRAVFVRGGTSRSLVFHHRDLPEDRRAWDPIFLAALGSPDPSGRQLDGLGGGISSLSKVAVVGPPTREDADVDYTFGQVEVTRPAVDYRGNCGNISSAIGPFAIDEALVPAREPATVVRIHNTNTRKLIHAHVPVERGQAAVRGDFTLDAVPGTGARIALDFLDPGGAVTGRLLPTGHAQDVLEVPGLATVTASLVDATNPMVFVRAKDLGLDGTEQPEDLDGRPGLPARLEAIRAAAAVRMGLARTPEEAARTSTAVPKIAIVAPPAGYRTLAGLAVEPHAVDLVARIVSMGKTHRAFALTGAMCLAVAARIPGTVASEAAALTGASGDVRIGHPSGVLAVAAAVVAGPDGTPTAQTVTVYRTARRLMEGFVLVP
jgi:2-methylaconitate cis-trans-isomerase PrpF